MNGLTTESMYFYQLWTMLMLNCPFDTGNTARNIEMEDHGDYYIISIKAPQKSGYDYAKAVNYALNAKAQGRTRSVKEERNYLWIERSIEQAKELLGIVGETVYELFE